MSCVSNRTMRLLLCGSLISLAMFTSVTAVAESIVAEEEAQKISFPEADSFKTKLIVMTKEQLLKVRGMAHSKNAGRVYKYSIATKKDLLLGYTVVDTVWGKRDPMDLMVALDPEGSVVSVQILAHAKSRGRDIINGRFLSQFEQKDVTDRIDAGKGIDVVSGATISSRAAIGGVRRILDQFAILGPVAIPARERL
jgi:Na+-translocating ferredoxin:NAD+ oxidoreductase RnfG subunit